MTRFDDLDRALTAYFDIEAAAPAPAGLLESAMTTTSRRRPRPAWHARLNAGSISAPRGETTRTLLIAAALIALLLFVVGFALLGGGGNSSPLVADASVQPSAPASTTPVAGGPVDPAFRATWLGFTPTLPSLGNGSGPVELAISVDGTHLSASNFAPGAEFDSTISAVAANQVELVLDRPSGGCEAGATGVYRVAAADKSSLLGLTPVSDECVSRSEALGRTWGRSLASPTSMGSGFVTTMSTPFYVSLPDQELSARTLDDMIEIGGPNGFSLMAFKNPQGFVDACSTEEERVPFVPGADAFADFLEQNPSLETVSREDLTIGGLPAIHIVTEVRPVSAGAPCEVPSEGLYLWTPKDCGCHFIGGHDSLYLVDLPDGDVLMFEVSPVDENNPVERQVIDSLRIPARLPGS